MLMILNFLQTFRNIPICKCKAIFHVYLVSLWIWECRCFLINVCKYAVHKNNHFYGLHNPHCNYNCGNYALTDKNSFVNLGIVRSHEGDH